MQFDSTLQVPDAQRICVIANPRSGTNARDREALSAAMEVLGPRARILQISPEAPAEKLVDIACAEGADMIVAAGGDGTATLVAGAMHGRPQSLAVLPLGTFNFFARGLGFSDDPAEAARQLIGGQPHPISVGTANGRLFLNNASLGIYPAVLRERESVYKTWGRRRITAHLSVVKTFLRYRRPLRLSVELDGVREDWRTALVFVARSAYQLETFGLRGAETISNDRLAILIAKAETRRDLWRMTMRLALRAAEPGDAYVFRSARRLVVECPSRRALLLAYDGEKRRETLPLTFAMSDTPLNVVLPHHRAEEVAE